ncbi:MAG: DUF2871 domain-containing protein [Cellulosilyticaceae bacterium]
MKKYLHMATFYLVLGLVAGVFYREFTKMSGFEGKTLLSVSHTHILVLGFLMGMMLLILEKNFKFSAVKHAKAWFIVYNCSFVYMMAMFITRGTMQVLGTSMAGLNHMAGLAHFLVGGSLIWFVVLCYKMIGNNITE